MWFAVLPSGTPSVVDACGVCGGNGTSCQCSDGYLAFNAADTQVGVLCETDASLVASIDAALAALKNFQTSLAKSNCEQSKQLSFSVWLNATQAFCSGNACPQLAPVQNLFAMLQNNLAFNLLLSATVAQQQQTIVQIM